MDRLSFEAPLTESLMAVPVRAHRERVAATALQAVSRRRYVVALAVLLSLAAGIAALLLLEKRYTAEATIQLDLSKREGAAANQMPAVVLEAAAVVQSEARIIESRVNARRVVEKLKLNDDPKYGPESTGSVSQFLTSGLVWLREFMGIAVPVMDDAALRTDLAVKEVLAHLKVGTDNRSYLISVGYTADNPVKAAAIANAFADEYLQRRIQANVDSAARTGEWLSGRIAETRIALRDAEAAIAAFRERTGMLEPGRPETGADAENMQQQQLRGVTSQLSVASLAKLNEERRLVRVQESVAAGGIPSTTDLPGSPLISVLIDREANARRELGELMSRLGAGHPNVIQAQAGLTDIKARLNAEVRRAVSLVAADVSAARRTEEELQGRLEALHRTMIGRKTVESELRNLQASAQSIREKLGALVRSNEQAQAARDVGPVVASLAVPAEPIRFPVFPKPVVIIGLALAGGLGAGVAAAMLLERRDQGFRTSNDVRSGSEARCLGMVPELSRRGFGALTSPCSGGGRGLALTPEQPVFDEAVYAVAAGVGLFSSRRDSRVVLVTSSLPGEGKSTLCLALARSLVATGQRVLIIDGAHLHNHDRGVAPSPPPAIRSWAALLPSEVTAGAPPVVVRRSDVSCLETAAFGPGRFASFIEEARRRFDVILLEGAPVLLVADSLVLGHLADTVIHVARWADTKQKVVNAALRRLREHSVTVDGLVLTRVNLRRHGGLGFFDECSFYKTEKQFYTKQAERNKPFPDSTSRVA